MGLEAKLVSESDDRIESHVSHNILLFAAVNMLRTVTIVIITIVILLSKAYYGFFARCE
jgi:membrane protein required for beta-lactamase induction